MKQKNLVLMVIAVGCGLVAAILTANMGKTAKVETVKVLVAAKDINTGTSITAENMEKLTKWKDVPKAGLPKDLVLDEETQKSLIGKRLSRPIRSEESINVNDLGKGTLTVFEEGKDIMSIPMTAKDASGGHVGPGSKVDILASLTDRDDHEVFTLLPDMHILAVNGIQELTGKGTFPDMRDVSLAVTAEQAQLLTLSKQRNCKLELLLRHPDSPPRKDWSLAVVQKKLLESKKQNFGTDVVDGKTDGKKDTVEPRIVVAMSKIYFAKEAIKPNTEITKELIEKSFEVKELATEDAKKLKAVGDLSQYTFPPKVFATGLVPGLPVTEGMIENPAPKPAPLEQVGISPDKGTGPQPPPELVEVYLAKEVILPETPITKELLDKLTKTERPKSEASAQRAVLDLAPFVGSGKVLTTGLTPGLPVTELMIGDKKKEVVVVVPKDVVIELGPTPRELAPTVPRIRDVAIHTPKGTTIYRFQETTPGSGDYRFKKKMAPDGSPPPPEAPVEPPKDPMTETKTTDGAN